MKRAVLFALAVVLTSTASAEMYRWVDAQGQVHYSDTPPPAGAKSEKTLPTAPASPTSAGAPPAQKSWQEKDAEFRQRQTDEAAAQAKKQKEQADEQDRKRNCELARRNLETLQSGQRVWTTDSSGQAGIMDDAGRAKATAEAQKAVDSWCK
jgi:hypothetical protein